MARLKGCYRDQKVELDQPLNIPDGTEVVVEVLSLEELEKEGWSELGMSRLEEEWDNSEDAVYDDWKTLYDA